ncbi:PTS sugar transporter subunit IIA [Fusibacter ferrireducens]|uniref:PTS glucose transporter subunit IIA n=1 Tax=Fusibacter ferrireducens TaxID=2785058 RepID=A0ABS0A074_9FIRM|nr:PTS glucose transporter subunit IIA [Fusibacter ferrireducens]MBF4695535.1 PTS glucose transporter subunit IIA [Fusibacter ferrireducens]
MGLLDKLKSKLNRNQEIYMPVAGKVIPLKELADGVFSEGLLGLGAGIEPEDNVVYAPCDGKIIYVAETKHALGLESKSGIEMIIHVGIDTVEMKGEGFEMFVKAGESITRGQKLISFPIEAIKAAGYRSTTVVIVTNSDQFESIQVLEEGKKIDDIMMQIV